MVPKLPPDSDPDHPDTIEPLGGRQLAEELRALSGDYTRMSRLTAHPEELDAAAALRVLLSHVLRGHVKR